MRQKQRVFSLFLLSPSSWRAWIEICPCALAAHELCVALLMEGVDRNIFPSVKQMISEGVALLMEGVDRNSAKIPVPNST